MISKDQKYNIICTIDECGETFYGRNTAQHPAAVTTNNNEKFRAFKSKENIHKKDDARRKRSLFVKTLWLCYDECMIRQEICTSATVKRVQRTEN